MNTYRDNMIKREFPTGLYVSHVYKEFAKEYETARADTLEGLTEMIDRIMGLDRLEYLRGEIGAERVSYGELAELASLQEYIGAGDVQLLEAAGVPEGAL